MISDLSLGLTAKVGQTAGYSTIDTSVSAVRRWTVLKIVFSSLNFLVGEASTCLRNGGRMARSRAFFMIKATELTSLCLIQEVTRRGDKQLTPGAGALSREEG